VSEMSALARHVSQNVLADVLVERGRQDAKWGEQNHHPFLWLTVLMEEVGELAEAALHGEFGGPAASGLRSEAIQVAAVAVAMVECLDRAAWARRQKEETASE
jgi:NTP pyrophosphatase (non-canonical NTP hydrolase)